MADATDAPRRRLAVKSCNVSGRRAGESSGVVSSPDVSGAVGSVRAEGRWS